LPALSAHTSCLMTAVVSRHHRPPDLVGCLCRPTHSCYFRRPLPPASMPIHCWRRRCL
jgi:hypothetical protein